MIKENNIYKPEDKGGKELFSMIIYRPIANIILIRFLKDSSLTPNMVSVISLIMALIASYLFYLHDYKHLIIGAFFLHMAYFFDVMDGQLARYKNMSSQFGRLFDAALDVVKVAFLFLAISSGIYMQTHNPLVLILGFIALSNAFLTFYMMVGKRLFMQSDSFAVKLKGNVYVGYEISLYLIITIFALINNLYIGLLFLATLGSLGWIKIFISMYGIHIKSKRTADRWLLLENITTNMIIQEFAQSLCTIEWCTNKKQEKNHRT